MPDNTPVPSVTNGHSDTPPQQTAKHRKRYAGVGDKVTPYHADVGDATFTFSRRPNARLQIEAMKTFTGRSDDQPMTAEDIELVGDVLQSMLHKPDELADLMTAVDLEALVELMGDAMEAVTARPTTESPDSGGTAPTTTPATGSPAPVSTGQTSTG